MWKISANGKFSTRNAYRAKNLIRRAYPGSWKKFLVLERTPVYESVLCGLLLMFAPLLPSGVANGLEAVPVVIFAITPMRCSLCLKELCCSLKNMDQSCVVMQDCYLF